MATMHDLRGMRFGHLTVTEYSHSAGSAGHSMWKAQCACGTEVIVRSGHLKSGHTRSCGCLSVVHGCYGTPTYRIWDAMMQRCTNPNHWSYYNYGGRGIGVDPAWKNFCNFLADVGERPAGMSLDRIDNSKGYSRDNCRWATSRQQANNRRNNRIVEYQGEKFTLSELARKLGLSFHVLFHRLRNGWQVGDPVKTGPYCTTKTD